MKEDQIFIDAALTCKRVITREDISKIILKDKTNKIKKYLNSFGIRQLAMFLQELHRTATGLNLDIVINEYADIKQRKVQLLNSRQFKPVFNKVPVNKLSVNECVYTFKGFTNTTQYFGQFLDTNMTLNDSPLEPALVEKVPTF